MDPAPDLDPAFLGSNFFPGFFAYYFLKVHLHQPSKIKSKT
jgi:hypothetical protein